MASPDRYVRSLWLVIVILVGTVAGLIGGTLAYLGGEHPARSIMVAGAAFGGCATLTVLLISFMRPSW